MASIAALMESGVSFADAWDMSPLDSRRLSAIRSAWSIPPEDRAGGARAARPEEAARLLESF